MKKNNFKVALKTEEVIFYCDFGSFKENSCARMYTSDMDMVKEGYLAHIALLEEFKKISNGLLTPTYISEELDEYIQTHAKFELNLKTDKYIFYVDQEECDDNGNTLMYDLDNNLISDNYFGHVGWLDELIRVEKGEVVPEYIYPDTEKYMNELVGNL